MQLDINIFCFYKYVVALIPGLPAPASHRRTAWCGHHGMACMVAHRRARRGAANLMRRSITEDIAQARGLQNPKIKFARSPKPCRPELGPTVFLDPSGSVGAAGSLGLIPEFSPFETKYASQQFRQPQIYRRVVISKTGLASKDTFSRSLLPTNISILVSSCSFRVQGWQPWLPTSSFKSY